MRIALFQHRGVPGDVDANLALVRRGAADAAAKGADLVVFPEMFLSGYNIGDRTLDLAMAPDAPPLRAVAAAAAEASIAVLTGYPERAGDHVHNAALLVDAGGSVLLNHRKVHLYGPGEKRLFRPGDGFVVARVAGCAVGVAICYDAEFPEAVRALALQGADVVAVPTALMTGYPRVLDTLIPARAYENQVFVCYANRCGAEGDTVYPGGSRIVAPDGTILAEAGAGDALVVADVDPAAFAGSRRANPYLADRRPTAYGPESRKGDR